LVGLCTSSKVNKSLENLSRFLDSKSICNKYGLNIEDPLVKIRKDKRKAKKAKKQFRNKPTSRKRRAISGHKKGYYKYIPKTHYYKPSDIHLQSHKQERWNKLTCWLCGKIGHTSNKCPVGEESRKNRGRKSIP